MHYVTPFSASFQDIMGDQGQWQTHFWYKIINEYKINSFGVQFSE